MRENFENIKEGKRWTVHLDMKAVKEITKGRKQKKERLALIVSSSIPKIDQLLGVPFVERATGVQQRDEVIKLLEEWGLTDQIIGISFDTTSDNTGVDNGSCKLIEECVGKAILWLACRRHVYELHIKHVATLVADFVSSRLSTNPEETLFKRLRDNWSELTEDEDWVDLDELNKFDWEAAKGSFLEDQALEVFGFLQNCLDTSTFPRSDYKELCVLCFVWLGGEVPSFRFRWPGACHRARFMMQSIYYMKLELLGKTITFVTSEEAREIKIMAEFVGLFYGQWFLRTAMSASAPYLDLTHFEQMQKYRKMGNIRAKIARTCMVSMARHTWYLDPSLVVMSLVDDNLPDSDKQAMAKKLSKIDRPEVFEKGKPKLGLLKINSRKVPSMASLIKPKSWLMFSLLDMTDDDVNWLKKDVSDWPEDQGFVKFKEFVNGLTVVNDPAERSIKLVQEFVNTCQDEELRQDLMLAVSENRKVNKVYKKSDLAEIGKK